ncbi:MAG TPA: phosphoenolpyruvate--protein phosphotransferase [Solirubrobacteraceae bacterium]|nr:phosphoenolpyruvate--protein phosphotransferase [Solirubrobacteraceae bacterium]
MVVSHSDALAQGVVTLAREMGGEDLALIAAGGTDEPGVLGTDAERVRAAIERAMSPDGVLVLMDLGSALMSTEFAIELLEDPPGRVLMSEAPLVEGTVAAAAAASGGASLEEVAAEARGALAMKTSQLGVAGDDGPAEPGADAPAPGLEAAIPVRNAIGLHARPAARFVETVRGFEADVRVKKVGGGAPVKATSLTNVVALGARFGDALLVSASGPQAQEVLVALAQLADEGFGDGVAAGAPPPNAAAAGAPPAAGALPAAGAPPAPGAPSATGAPPAPGAPPSHPPGWPASQAGQGEGGPEVAPPAAGDVLTGVPASAGLAFGPAHHLHGVTAPPPDRAADEPARERERLEQGITAARTAIERDRDTVASRAGKADAAIFDAHLALLDDEAMLDPAEHAIESGATAERAWYDAAQQVAALYRALEEPLLQERAADVLDVGRRVVDALIGGGDETHDRAGVVIAGELTPGDAATLDPALVTGIVTAHGTATAHAAILARALGLPAVVGLGESVLGITDGTTLLVDGEAGTVQVDPPQEVLNDATDRRQRAERRRASARERAHETGATRDGTRIEVFANLGSAGEAARAVELGAEGVGLLRTEFLFLDRLELPDEDEQAATLRAIAKALDGRPLVVRTLDAGADKPLPALPMPPEGNPFLGVRGIRLGLERRDVLATQFRAILRVANDHPLKVMLPMVATLDEILAARGELDQARADTGIDAPIEFGIMVEVPAAALTAQRLAEHVDFFSLGTNDLTQYTMAAERGDERLAPLLTGPQPAVLRLVEETVQAAAAHGRWVGVCGELAGDPASAILFAGLGVTELSMAPALVPEAKAALRGVDLEQARTAAQDALATDTAAAARALAAALL